MFLFFNYLLFLHLNENDERKSVEQFFFYLAEDQANEREKKKRDNFAKLLSTNADTHKYRYPHSELQKFDVRPQTKKHFDNDPNTFGNECDREKWLDDRVSGAFNVSVVAKNEQLWCLCL